MATITTRSGKGSALTHTEMDNNFTNLNSDKIEAFTLAGNVSGTLASNVLTINLNAQQTNITSVGTLGNLTVSGTVFATNITGAAGNPIIISSDGTEDIHLNADTVRVGDNNVDAIVSSHGTGDLTLRTNLGGSTEANLTLHNGSNGNIDITAHGSGTINTTALRVTGNIRTTGALLGAELQNFKETTANLTYASTITPNVANASIQTVTLTGNVTFSQFENPVAGQSFTLILKQDSTGNRLLTSNMKFAGNSKTLSTAANAIDIISSVYSNDGVYYASLNKGFV